jgi:L-ascorbate 6-phosphate lactonase
MMNLKEIVLSAKKGEPHIYFVGQAGFIFQTSKGTLLGVDLYLSNCVERFDGFKRLLPYVLHPEDLKFDFLISTHAHYDHFDVDSIPVLLTKKSKLYATERCKFEAEKFKIDTTNIEFIKYLDKRILKDFTIDFVFSDWFRS